MKKQELFPLLKGLNDVANYPGAKFAYAVAKNIQVVTEECKLLEKLQEPTEAFKAFEAERMDAILKVAETDETGSPKVTNNQYTILAENREQFTLDMQVLQEKHKLALEARDKQIAEFNQLLEELIDITIFSIKAELLPEDITAAQITAIMAIIED
jgi:demethoxyubiquinone hydroxylase (CLK1/Coq7/Cat5 family)